MRRRTYQKIDCQMHTVTRSFDELRLLRHCGVTDIISTLYIPVRPESPETFRDLFRWILYAEVKRGEEAGINIHPAIGIHPLMVPKNEKMLEKAMKFVEDAIRTKKVVAVGETGIELGTAEEFQAFKMHLELARKYDLPVIIHTPSRQKAELSKIIYHELRKSKVDKALVDHINAENIRIFLQDPRPDIKLGLSIQEGRNLSIRDAILLYKNYSYENRFCLSSNAGSAHTDVLSLVKAVEGFEAASVNPKIIEKLCYFNAVNLFRRILDSTPII